MELHQNHYYHIYNRSNNNEIAFKSSENYLYFLKKFQHYLSVDLDCLAYCLMPTHFHFLVFVKSEDDMRVKEKFGVLLSSYTKAINQRYARHGSLFQNHTKSRHIDNERYLMTLMTYIHQNPVRAGLVKKLEDWQYSSYGEYVGTTTGNLMKRDIINDYFSSVEEFKEFSSVPVEFVEKKYWI